MERSFHQPQSGKPCTHCSGTKVMKCVDLHSLVLSKMNACVSERNVVCSVNRLEKSGDWHAMIREKFCFQSGAGLGVIQVNADKASCNASFHSIPRQIKPRTLGPEVILSTCMQIT